MTFATFLVKVCTIRFSKKDIFIHLTSPKPVVTNLWELQKGFLESRGSYF